MVKGVGFAVLACFMWGLIFIIPDYMRAFDAVEIAFGRYIFYGSLSIIFFLKGWVKGQFRFSKKIWLKVLLFSLMCTYGYYMFVILSVRFSGVPLCALILGLAPITIALYGNWLQKEVSYKSLLIPSALILLGLAAINAPQVVGGEVSLKYFLGILCSFFALASWTWYVVANVRFFREQNEIKASDWSTLIGVGALIWTAVFGICYLCSGGTVDLQKYSFSSGHLSQFVIGCSILGFLCSWVGAVLWNKASLSLPVSLAAQIMIVETVFAVIFAYLLKRALPPSLECLGIILFFVAILYGIKRPSLIKHI